ncbi:hypothetical protein ACLOJK_019211 [Asimina triloba]
MHRRSTIICCRRWVRRRAAHCPIQPDHLLHPTRKSSDLQTASNNGSRNPSNQEASLPAAFPKLPWRTDPSSMSLAISSPQTQQDRQSGSDQRSGSTVFVRILNSRRSKPWHPSVAHSSKIGRHLHEPASADESAIIRPLTVPSKPFTIRSSSRSKIQRTQNGT